MTGRTDLGRGMGWNHSPGRAPVGLRVGPGPQPVRTGGFQPMARLGARGAPRARRPRAAPNSRPPPGRRSVPARAEPPPPVAAETCTAVDQAIIADPERPLLSRFGCDFHEASPAASRRRPRGPPRSGGCPATQPAPQGTRGLKVEALLGVWLRASGHQPSRLTGAERSGQSRTGRGLSAGKLSPQPDSSRTSVTDVSEPHVLLTTARPRRAGRLRGNMPSGA